jgi:polynucleotide kinase-phosphatase
MKEIKLPEISLVLLIGASSSGKSTFAKKYFLPTEVISSDYCRALVSDNENDLSATNAAFELLHFLAAKRLKLGKFTVIDALNLRKEDRAKLVQLAKDNYALAAAIILETPIRKLFDRHETRTDRNFGKNVLERQFDDFKRSMRTIEREGFSYTYFINPEEEITIYRQPLWNNKKDEKGPFDIIGDIHGCFDELLELLSKLGYSISQTEDGHFEVQNPENRRAIFLGDLTDRGNKSPQVLRLVMDMVKTGKAFCIAGNHDDKLNKYLNGKNVNAAHGLEKTIQQLATASNEFKKEVKEFLNGLIAHYVLDDGKLVVAHGGLPEEMQGRAAAAVRAFCLFGETTGEIDEFGLPVRYNWAKNYKGKAMVVYGHTPVPETEWLNNTINIDTGCVFGGKLTGLRYPEKEIVSVESKKVYCEPIRPIQTEIKQQLSAQHEFDDLLDIDIINGKYLVKTKFHSKVIIREENAVAALEVMSRFALNPKWLIYLPPTMSPPETSKLENYLEHPQEVFNYYYKNGITKLICEEKHMGSRAIAIVCKTSDVATKRFGLIQESLGTIYTRTGRRFFEKEEVENQFLIVLNDALTKSNFWEQQNTDWVCLDGELMPWSAKAKELLIKQYAAVGSSATNSLSNVISALQQAKDRGIKVDRLIEKYSSRRTSIEKYITSYRHYSRDTNGIEGLVYAPFHILATEGKTYFDKQHTWHLENIKTFCDHNTAYLMVTANKLVDLNDETSIQQAIDWWTDLTGKGGEGMVVKPFDYITSSKGRTVQPAMKCRGSEYLRIIYGAEYDLGDNLKNLKERNVKVKRDLAIKEFTLGLEALDRFVNREPLRRIHECVFGVLALESEPVDPRL